MKRLTKDCIEALVLIAISIYVIIASLQLPIHDNWGVSPGLVPLIFGIALLLLSLVYLQASLKHQGKQPPVAISKYFQALSDIKSPQFLNMFTILFVLVYILLLPVFGFFPTTGVFVLVGMWFFARQVSKLSGIIAAIGTVAGIYLIFVVLFKMVIRF